MSEVMVLIASEERKAWAALKAADPMTDPVRWHELLADWRKKEELRHSEFKARAAMAGKVADGVMT